MTKEFTSVAIVCEAPKAELKLEEIIVPPIQPYECLVEMIASGICHTDLTCQLGALTSTYPIVLGHEGSGIVTAVGDDVPKHIKVGDKVLMSYSSCQNCKWCKVGKNCYCVKSIPLGFDAKRRDGTLPFRGKDGREIGGQFFGQSSFAKDSVVNYTSIVVVNELSDEEMRLLAPLGCGLQTGSGAVFNTLQAKEGESIAVFGCGGVGFGAIWAAKILGCSPIIVIDLAQNRLDLAKELGATHVINAANTKDVIKRIEEFNGGYGVDNSVETTGVARVLRQCCDAVGAVGKVAVIGAGPNAALQYEVSEFIRKGTQIRGVCMGGGVPQKV
jgi:aryl-alcohol dehydrogenase